MSSLQLLHETANEALSAVLREQLLEQLLWEETWFSEAPPSSMRRSSVPPPVESVGEFLGDPLADAWLR